MNDAGHVSSVQPRSLLCTAQYIAWHARATPGATAIVEAGVRVTYGELAADLLRYVCALRSIPIRPGMLVGVATMNRYLHLQVLLACEVVGATTLSLVRSELTTENVLLRGCDVLLTDSRLALGFPPKTVVMSAEWLAEVAMPGTEPMDLALLDRNIPGRTVVRIARSSGTTGSPKLIEMSLAKQQLVVARNAEWVADGLAQRQAFLSMYHLTVRSNYHRVLGCLQHGGTVYFAMETEVFDLIAAGAVNAVMFVVGDIQRLVQHARSPPPGQPLHVWTIGTALSRRLRQLIRQRLNAQVFSYYSSNETGRVACMDDDNVGTLCPGVEVRIVDEDGKDNPIGKAGLIHVRAETMVDGYRNDPKLTASRFVDGWFHTRDMGFMPAPGRLVVVGRADDMLDVGGVKFPPAPIEEQIKAIDGITDAAVLSIDTTNEVAALLVAIETAAGEAMSGLAERLDPIVSPYLRTFRVMVTQQFPRTGTGKIKREKLVGQYLQARMQSRNT